MFNVTAIFINLANLCSKSAFTPTTITVFLMSSHGSCQSTLKCSNLSDIDCKNLTENNIFQYLLKKCFRCIGDNS